MSYTTTGRIKVIQDIQTFPSGFTKREFIVTIPDDRFPQELKFEFVKDKCDKLDQFQADDEVTVEFDIRGNEHKGKWYVSLSAWRIKAIQGEQQSQEQPAPSQPAPQSTQPHHSDIDTGAGEEPPF